MSELRRDNESSEKIHPEELIDRALRSELLDSEWKKLRQHLSTCPPCAAHLQLAATADATTARLTQSAASARDTQLNRVAAHQVLQKLEGSRRGGHLLSPRRWVQVAAGLALLSGTATAATWWAVRRTPPAVISGPVTTVAVRSPRLPGSPSHAAHAAPIVAGAASPQETPLVITPAPEAFDQLASAELARSRARGRDGTRNLGSATALLQQARRMRMAGDDAGARATYLRLQQLHPRSSESHLSHLLLGRLYLESGREQSAVREFATYLDVGGAASEEALVGRATALAHLGRTTEETAAWRTLLDEYPRSLYAARARARLARPTAGEHPRSSTTPIIR